MDYYKLLAVIDTSEHSDRNPYNKGFILTTSSPCLSASTVKIILSKLGLEDPNSEILVVDNAEIINAHNSRVQFRFLDGGLYNGIIARTRVDSFIYKYFIEEHFPSYVDGPIYFIYDIYSSQFNND